MDRIKIRLSQVESEKIEIERKFSGLMQEVSPRNITLAGLVIDRQRFFSSLHISKSERYMSWSLWLKQRSTTRRICRNRLNSSSVKWSAPEPLSVILAVRVATAITQSTLTLERLLSPRHILRSRLSSAHYVVRAITRWWRVRCTTTRTWTSLPERRVLPQLEGHLLRGGEADCGRRMSGVTIAM
jgi:hypothetical protein